MPTIRDVARMAGVSVSTVSLTYSNPDRVSGDTKRRVYDAVETLQYRPKGSARDLRAQKTNMVAVLLHNLSGPFYSELVAGVEDVANSLGLTTIACGNAQSHEQGALRLLREARVDGAIILDPTIPTTDLRRYAGNQLPMVLLDRRLSSDLRSPFITAVAADHEAGGYMAGEHLLSQGYSRFAVIAGPIESEDSQLRLTGFFRALKESSIDPATVPVIHSDFTEGGGHKAMTTLLSSSIVFDALFCANDEMAIGAIPVLTAHHRRIADDVGVIGFDDIRLARYIDPPLTTVRQPMYELGMAAMNQLFQAMTTKQSAKPTVLPVTLVPRASTAKAEKRGVTRDVR